MASKSILIFLLALFLAISATAAPAHRDDFPKVLLPRKGQTYKIGTELLVKYSINPNPANVTNLDIFVTGPKGFKSVVMRNAKHTNSDSKPITYHAYGMPTGIKPGNYNVEFHAKYVVKHKLVTEVRKVPIHVVRKGRNDDDDDDDDDNDDDDNGDDGDDDGDDDDDDN